MKYNIIVIGAGAAGLIAAGRAAELGAKVLILEKMNTEGKKLLITGKGRCNITNEASQAEYFKRIHPNGRFLKHAFSEFFNTDIVQLLNKQGLETKSERGGRIFPASDSSRDVLKALLDWNSKLGVRIQLNSKLEAILVENNQIKGIEYQINGRRESLQTEKLIICTGGASYPATGSNGDAYKIIKSLGHKIEPIRPALVPLETEGSLAEKLMGLSLKNVTASLWVNGKKQAEEFGEMLFAHFGLSGPIILTLSRLAVDELRKNNKVEVSIDLKPALDDQKLDARLLRDLNENGKKKIGTIFKLWLPGKLVPEMMELAEIDAEKECHQVAAKERKKIKTLMKDFRFKVTSARSFKEAIITAGGVNTSEIDSKTMESKIIKNLYFAGEVIDLDADTGGYNLQIAYSTAWLAAQSAAKKEV